MKGPEDTTTSQTRVSGTQVRIDDTGPVLVQHRLRLRVLDGPDKGLEKEIESPRVSIGAAPLNDVVLTDRLVSRHHCEIVVRDTRYFLRDLGSTNGTFLNETRIVEALLTPGARLRVGRSEIVFEPKKRWERLEGSQEEQFGAMVGCSASMKALFGLLARVARSDLSVVILGETGTGKELAARALHDNSVRAAGPFVVVDCGAVSETLVEAEIFGHEKGAFTGADRARPGAFEAAQGGTVFLDEIGDLSLDLQPKLLRVLEQREVKRLGANMPVEVDVRIVCATHRALAEMVEQGKFREDLYYRLAEVVVEIPALRERPEDVELIARRIVEQESKHGAPAKAISKDTLDALRARHWSGNVRELRNVLRRAAALASGAELQPADLQVASPPRAEPPPPEINTGATNLPEGMERLTIKDARDRWNAILEKQYLERLMKHTQDDIERAAEIADIHYKSLRRLLRQHGMLE